MSAAQEGPAGIGVLAAPGSQMTSVRMSVEEPARLARLIAIILMGQAEHAAEIVTKFAPQRPVVREHLVANALASIALDHSTENKLAASRWSRDGLLFECISWLGSHLEAHVGERISTAPHLKSTTQGLDGLLIDWIVDENRVAIATILEDKCSEHPRKVFRDEVLATFRSHHNGERDTELIASASTLIKQTGLSGLAAVAAATTIVDESRRAYRAGLAVTDDFDSTEARDRLFKGFEDLDGIGIESRIGATLIVDGTDLRAWFDQLAALVANQINELGEELADVR